jgi:superfamily II DNA or RNA helicase
MTFELRPYQQEFADNIIKGLAKHKRIIACAATGAGKTKTFIYLAQRAMSKGLTVLVLTESTKIYDQLTDELHAGNINADTRDQYIAPGHIYIAMAQTLVRRPKMIGQFIDQADKLLIITDEAHIGTPTKLLQQFPAALHIGFTATPDYRFAKHLPALYNDCIIGPQPDELVTNGYLSPYRHYARVLANLDELKIKNGEFTEETQERVFESKKVYDGLIDDLSTITFGKALIFTASIKHCEDVYAQLTAAGVSAIRIHSKLPQAQQTFDMARYRSTDQANRIDICISVGILTKGFDFPAIDLIILNRATTSLPLYLQMIGRGSRTFDGKQFFTVLDYGGNYERHGLWDAAIDWSKKWKEKKKKKDGVAPVKLCPSCDYINHVSASVCKNCGYVFEHIPIVDDEATKLIEITASYRKLTGRLISTLEPHELALYARFKNKKGYACRIARAKHQAGDSSYLLSFASAMGYKPSWTHFQAEQINGEKIEFHDIVLR